MVIIAFTGWYQAPAAALPSGKPLVLDINNIAPVKPSPNYDKEVLEPLRQAQAKAAKEKRLADEREAERLRQLEPAREVRTVQVLVAPITGDCNSWMDEAGITDKANAYWLVIKESGCDPNNWNGKAQGVPWSADRACGLGQQLPCGKWPHAWNDPVGGFIDMQNYVIGRYGSWQEAVNYWRVHGNY